MMQRRMLHLYRAFPWIGLYLYTFQRNNYKGKGWLIMAFVMTMVIFYCMYLASLSIVTVVIFNGPHAGVNESYYGFLALLEFASLVFIRTRSSLKFFPLLTNLILFIFCYYFQATLFGFYQLGFYVANFWILFFFAYLLRTYEIPSVNTWNQFHHYVPNENKPRCMYFPLFSLNWLHDLPPLWTMFYPMADRSTFTPA